MTSGGLQSGIIAACAWSVQGDTLLNTCDLLPKSGQSSGLAQRLWNSADRRIGVARCYLTRHDAPTGEAMFHAGRAKSMPNETRRKFM
jgi:hypothetical protein